MKISVWRKYHFIKWGLIISLFIGISVLLSKHYNLIAIISLILGPLVITIALHSIKCPICGKPIDNYYTLFSGPEGGLLEPMSKKCKNCGFNFCESEIKKYNKDSQK